MPLLITLGFIVLDFVLVILLVKVLLTDCLEMTWCWSSWSDKL